MHNWDGSWRINFSARFSPSFALPRILLWSSGFAYFTAVLAVDTPRCALCGGIHMIKWVCPARIFF